MTLDAADASHAEEAESSRDAERALIVGVSRS